MSALFDSAYLSQNWIVVILFAVVVYIAYKSWKARHQYPKRLDPIFEPRHNAREICKQCVLLEDHLNNPRLRCKDCINKHFLTIEALGEEGVALERNQHKSCPPLEVVPKKSKELHDKWKRGQECDKIAQEVRALRKTLMPYAEAMDKQQKESEEKKDEKEKAAKLAQARFKSAQTPYKGAKVPPFAKYASPYTQYPKLHNYKKPLAGCAPCAAALLLL
jgi:hypothetical protein